MWQAQGGRHLTAGEGGLLSMWLTAGSSIVFHV